MTDGKNDEYQISDEVWKQIEPLLAPECSHSVNIHKQIDNRRAMEVIFYMLHKGFGWNDVPISLEAKENVHSYFLEWSETGAFERMWQVGILTYDELRKLVFLQ